MSPKPLCCQRGSSKPARRLGGGGLADQYSMDREEAQICLSHPGSPSFPHPKILTPAKTCMPINTQFPLSDSDAVRLGSTEKEREGRQAFVEVHFCSHAVLQGRPEIDMILLTGTWIALAKVHAASIPYLEMIRSIFAHFNLCTSQIFSNLNVSFMQGSQMLSSCTSLKRPGLYCEEEKEFVSLPLTSKCFIYFQIKSYCKNIFLSSLKMQSQRKIGSATFMPPCGVVDPCRKNVWHSQPNTDAWRRHKNPIMLIFKWLPSVFESSLETN